jgi:energy-coupling factor transport system substrate-specific component
MMGYVGKKIRIEEGEFATKEMIFFNISQAIIHLISWGLIAPALDILIYSEPANKVFIQGAAGSIGNIVSTAIVGTILCATYASTRAKKGSLKLEEE